MINKQNNIFKTTFTDGTTHFFRVPSSRNKTPKSYIAYQYSTYKHNVSNPNRSSNVTEFETRVAQELNTLKCELVFSGTEQQCKVERDRLIKVTDKCMNFKSSSNDSTGRMGSKLLVQIKSEYVKTLSAIDGTKLYFINMEYGFRRALKENMVTYKKHPLNPNFVQIIGLEIEKI